MKDYGAKMEKNAYSKAEFSLNSVEDPTLIVQKVRRNESYDHIRLKSYVKDLLTSYKGNVSATYLERRVGARVADMYCTLKRSTENIAVEIQKSPISVNQLISRTEDEFSDYISEFIEFQSSC